MYSPHYSLFVDAKDQSYSPLLREESDRLKLRSCVKRFLFDLSQD